MPREIPEVVVDRLPAYYRELRRLNDQGYSSTSSQQLGDALGVSPAQIRKDLAHFGRFGKQGRGYSVAGLLDELQAILGLDQPRRMALVGVGRLGQAIAAYDGFAAEGFEIAYAYDAAAKAIGTTVNGVTVRDVRELEGDLSADPVDIGIVAVPAGQAQDVADVLVRVGVRSILSYAPIPLQVPRDVHMRRIDPVLSLQSMAYYLHRGSASEARASQTRAEADRREGASARRR